MRHVPKLLAAAVAIMPPSAVRADSIPRYNPRSYCETVAESVGGSSMILNGCIEQEQMAYDALKADWRSIPNRTQSYCDEVARSVGGIYAILKGCVEQEVNAAGSTPDFKY